VKRRLPINRDVDDLIGSGIDLDIVEPLRQQVTDSQFWHERRELGRKATASAAQNVYVTNRASSRGAAKSPAPAYGTPAGPQLAPVRVRATHHVS